MLQCELMAYMIYQLGLIVKFFSKEYKIPSNDKLLPWFEKPKPEPYVFRNAPWIKRGVANTEDTN